MSVDRVGPDAEFDALLPPPAAPESTAPPPMGGGNLKYGVIGVVLLAAAVGLWFAMDEGDPDPTPVAAVTADAGTVHRETALVDDDLVIPDPPSDAGPGVDAAPRIRYVTRYVGGGGWNCSGSLEPAAARAALAGHNLQFRNCYERRLKVNNSLEGRVQVQIRVGRDGRVSGVQTGGSLRDRQVLTCVRGVAQRITFPHPTGGCAVVAQPFNFTPRR